MRKPLLIISCVAALVVLAWLLTPAPLAYSAAPVVPPDDLDTWLAEREHVVSESFELVPGSEKRVRWQEPGVRTRYVIVYLHGFSATRQEVAPLAEIVADRLGANLFETRLTGHGHTRLPMHEVRAEDWLQDAAEALAVGQVLGDEIILIGTSTGATLALAMAGQPQMQRVRSMVFISPNMAPRDPAAEWLTRPAGPLIARLLVGETRSWTPHNELQARYWSTSYPLAATVEVMRLVDAARARTGIPLEQDLLVLMSPDDEVISTTAARDAYEAITAPRKQLVEIHDAGDPSHHVLAGDILSPGSTAGIADLIIEFLQPATDEAG